MLTADPVTRKCGKLGAKRFAYTGHMTKVLTYPGVNSAPAKYTLQACLWPRYPDPDDLGLTEEVKKCWQDIPKVSLLSTFSWKLCATDIAVRFSSMPGVRVPQAGRCAYDARLS